NVFLYLPSANRVEKMKLKDTEDMRAPLAFLLGKLNFEKEFRNTQARGDGDATVITAEPKSDNLPYSRVEFTVAPTFEIRKLLLTNLDQTTLEFAFEAEKLNPPLTNGLFQFQAPAGAEVVDEGGEDRIRSQALENKMSDWVLKYADARGEIHQQVAQAASEQQGADCFGQQGFLIYSIRPRRAARGLSTEVSLLGRRKKLNLEKFLIFNQQFVTLIRAGLPILKGLDLLADRLTDPKLGAYIKSVRDEVRKGTLLSEAFRMQGVFPKIYVTSVMAGEKSGSLGEVLDRYIAYQKLALAVRKKILVSLLYPAVLIFLVLCLIVFLVTFVVPNFAQLYSSMSAQLPAITQVLIAVGTTARNYVLVFFAALVAAGLLFAWWA